MPSENPRLSPAAFRSPKRGTSTFLWVAVLFVAAAGLVYAAVDVSNGTATSGAADSSFAPPAPSVEPDLVQPARAAPAKPSAPAASTVDPIQQQLERAAREREADMLIEQLKVKLRAEREARLESRTSR